MPKKIVIYYQLFYLTWSTFWEIYRNIQRRIELRELTNWAKKKHLLGLIRFYHNRHLDEEVRFNRYLLRHPHLTQLACWMSCLVQQLRTTPPIYPRGYASKYRRHNTA